MTEYVFNKVCVETWGANKTMELVLIAVCTATASVIIGNHIIPNDPTTIEKEN